MNNRYSSLPNDATGEALLRIEKIGGNLSKPLMMDFYFSADTKNIVDQISVIAQKKGFSTNIEFDEESQRWACDCEKVLIPTYKEIVDIENYFTEACYRLNCEYEGFGSDGIQAETQ